VRRLQVLSLPGGYPGREAKAGLLEGSRQLSVLSSQSRTARSFDWPL